MGTVWASAVAGRALEPVANAALWHPASIEVLQGIQLELSSQSSCPLYRNLSLSLLHHNQGVCSTTSLGASGISLKGSRNLFCCLFSFWCFLFQEKRSGSASILSRAIPVLLLNEMKSLGLKSHYVVLFAFILKLFFL